MGSNVLLKVMFHTVVNKPVSFFREETSVTVYIEPEPCKLSRLFSGTSTPLGVRVPTT